MAGLLDTRLAREEASIFDELYAAARQQEAALDEQGRRSVLGGLFSKEPVQGIDTVRFEGMPGLLSMLTPAAKAVDAPISAYRGLIPEQDMLGEALGTAGLTMGGAGLAAGRLPDGAVAANIPVMQGRSRQGLTDFFNPDGVSWGTDSKSTAEQFAGKDAGLVYKYNDEGKLEVSEADSYLPGQVYDLNYDLENPMQVPIKDTLWTREKELAKIAEAKAKGHDGLKIVHGTPDADGKYPKTDYVAFDPSQVSTVNANASKSAGLLAAGLPEPRNAGEAMAQRILEMRAAGKAGDVTDEMMAQADPQYMFNNTPLDMSEAARMARAGRFDADAYHATGNDFAQFVPSKFRGASFFGPTPIGASSGANASKNEGIGSGSNITIPVKIDASGVEGLGAYSRKLDNDFRSSLTDRVYSEAELDKMKSNGDFPRYTDWTTFFDDFTDYDALRAFRDANPDGSIPDGIIAFKPKQAIKYGPKLTHDLSGRQFAHYSEGMSEKPTSDYVKSQGNTGFTMSDESGIALAVTNPANIRSRFARFDPEFSHLSNLSAANASPLTGLMAMQAQPQPDLAAEIRAYLESIQ